jgi:pyruvate/2-oxoglutarate dehydrogenase complex dihydrolipoamide dehydrogenase (E3) component
LRVERARTPDFLPDTNVSRRGQYNQRLMTPYQTYDAIIIGTGQAGPPLAKRLSDAGMSVAIVERHLFGGTCVNTGCIPTKAMVASAYATHVARRASDYGVVIDGAVRADMTRVKSRKDAISEKSRVGVEQWLRGLPRCTVYTGHARFTSAHDVTVGDHTMTADRIFINVGGRASVPQMPGLDRVPFLTNSSMMHLDRLPPHLVIIGGSYVGLEFGQMFRRFGSEVSIIEMTSRLLPREDPDIGASIHEILTSEGINLRVNAKCIRVSGGEGAVTADVDCENGSPSVDGTHLLLAVGRRPNTDDLGLDAAGIARDERGYIIVNDQLETNVSGVWALGDCNGKGAFTHTSYNDFEIVAANLFDGDHRRVSDRILAYALYIDPPLGRAGMTETEAQRTGHTVLVGKRPMTRVGRAIEKGETKGLMKIVVDAQSQEILGAAILGTGGDEAIHCVLDTMYAKAPYPVLKRAMHIHPTVSELIPTILGEATPA